MIERATMASKAVPGGWCCFPGHGLPKSGRNSRNTA